jgi:uncharacterized protein (DUF58 family)
MRRQGSGSHGVSRARPVGVSAGGLGLLIAWVGGAAIAQLTGATPVVIVLTAGLVWFAAGVIAGWVAIRRATVERVTMPALSTQGVAFPIEIEIDGTRGSHVWVALRSGGSAVASGWAGPGGFRGDAVMTTRGAVRTVHVEARAAGATGLVWWRKRFEIEVAEHVVAPAARSGSASVTRLTAETNGDLTGRSGAVSGEIDGVRPWREGDSEKFVHWTSSLRSGELIVHDRRHTADQRWLVRARPGTDTPDDEAGRARSAIEQGLRRGAVVSAAIGDGPAVLIPDLPAAARWSALAELGRVHEAGAPKLPRHDPVEPETSARQSARWWAAGATVVSLVMLTGALSYGPIVTLVVVAAVVGGAAFTARPLVTGATLPATARTVVGIAALVAFGMVAVSVGQIGGLLGILRGPLPQILVILVALHGFECRDRRTLRVGLGISAVVLMYALGFRVDSSIIWWLGTWAVCFGMAMAKLALPTVPSAAVTEGVDAVDAPPIRGVSFAAPRPARALAVLTGAVATVGVLLVVPVPDSPARLTLPTFLDELRSVNTPGALAGPAGNVVTSGDDSGGTRSGDGGAGGYTGFAESMDTSVRGPLSDQVVMRVRAPEPDFWRGQTFARFDGRQWYADDDVGVLGSGPSILVPPALGDWHEPDGVDTDRFVQTFYVEQDMPNIVFAAYRPTRVVLDADVWTRPDGALRAATTLTAGSIYTVISSRARVTADVLRAQGETDHRLSAFGKEVLADYLTVPDSTTDRTIALADELAADTSSTYDMVLAFEAWLSQHVEYDLNAPVPAQGVDAVDDFLFTSRRGFCEQIASALAVMLRTQGVPTRVATGYVAGDRDEIAGVFEVRGSDAHAWVEVWFPDTGWQAFDPTASVPLAGDAQIASVGADLFGGASDFAGAHAMPLALGGLSAAGLLVIACLVRDLRHRRRRGRWGLLQDRFGAVAAARGADPGATNPDRAAAWTTADDLAVAELLASRLDRVAFDPTFGDDDAEFAEARKLVESLRGRRR